MAGLIVFAWRLVALVILFGPQWATAAVAGGIDLRIHPIGDSITFGYMSSDNNGYRKYLLDKLSGNAVRYIGSSASGTMVNNQNDGYSGNEIAEIAGKIGSALAQRPNLVLVMAGTNDVNKNDNVSDAPNRLGAMLDKIISACPDATIILAKITPITDGAAQSRAQQYNSAIVSIAQTRINAGRKILMVDMQDANNGLKTSDLIDGLHPSDAGYAKMATVWYNGINAAAAKGWITAPVAGTAITAGASCGGDLFWYNNYGTIGTGVGTSDVAFKSSWQPVGNVASGVGPGSGVRIADMDGDGFADFLQINETTGAATLFRNGGYANGKVNWQPMGQIASGIGDGAGVRFADLTGDGMADYIWISPFGDITVYMNGGLNSTGGWTWIPLGDCMQGVDRGTRDTFVFADLNGDGRADVSVLGASGALKSWIAGGGNPEPLWFPQGKVATGIGDAAGVRLADLNGDRRADYIWLNNATASNAYINTRSMNDLKPAWVDAGQIGTGVPGANRSSIIFGDLTGDGRADLLIVNNATGAVDMYVNLGSGGSYQAGDLVTFADLDGDGLDEYISVSPTGALTVYRNGGPNTAANRGWLWIEKGTIASGVCRRQALRLADLDGDGKADYICVDDKTGAIAVWMNGGQDPKDSSKWIWRPINTIASGIGPGRTIRFADIDGDGRADYLSIGPSGSVTAYLNGGANAQANLGWLWINMGVIASGAGQGSEIRFADIDGDGRADYLVVRQSQGNVELYRNGGANTAAAGGWLWLPQGQIATGVGATSDSVVFGSVSSRRADYLVVTPSSGAIYLWANGCNGPIGTGVRKQTVPRTGDAMGGGAPAGSLCQDADWMYYNDSVPLGTINAFAGDGSHLQHSLGNPRNSITVVNLTPTKFIHKTIEQPYQFTRWDFGDVYSGKARKNEVTYDNSNGVNFVDTNGYAYYTLEGTGKTFIVHVTQHVNDKYERRVVFDLGGMGMGWRELGFPGDGVNVALVITGSEKYGYITSLQVNTPNWMRQMYGVIKDRALRHVVVPGSHDGGMSRLSGSDSGFIGVGIWSNTQTQELDHYNELVTGTRYFDMRIVSVNRGAFWAAHVNDNLNNVVPAGATGDSLDALIAGVNRFNDDYPGELIVWRIRYMSDLDSKRSGVDYHYWDTNKANEFYAKLTAIKNRCIGLDNTGDNTLEKQPMRTFMDQNGGKGCVLLLTDGSLPANTVPVDKPEVGIYHQLRWLSFDDYWSDVVGTKQTADKQKIRMRDHARFANSSADNYFIMQWHPNLDLDHGIIPIANQEANPALYHYGLNEMSPWHFPTVIEEDGIGLFYYPDKNSANYNAALQTLAIGLNLYMVPQNCKISTVKHPLLGAKVQSRDTSAGPTSSFDVFNGVIFANGTVLDKRPTNFCATCTYNDTVAIDHKPGLHKATILM